MCRKKKEMVKVEREEMKIYRFGSRGMDANRTQQPP